MKLLEWAASTPKLVALLVLALAGCTSNGQDERDAGPDGLDAYEGDPGPASCTSIGDCPAFHLCLNNICQPGTQCASDIDCPLNYLCNVMLQVCMPENPCTSDTDCLGATPHCALSGGICVACLQDEHCFTTPETSRCSPGGECVACTLDEHCPPDTLCNSTYLCEELAPECSSDTDCTDPSRSHCDPQTHTCQACVTDADCTDAVCEPITHRCVECHADIHCQDDDRCKLTSFTCVTCLIDDDCPQGERCNQGSNQCTEEICTSDPDCASQTGRPKCNTATGDCVRCLEHGDCYANQWCRDFSCETECSTDAECQQTEGEHYHCDTDSGDCYFAECLTDADCAGNADKPHCKTSEIPSQPAQYSCVRCTQDQHCDELFECSPTEFVCRPMPCYRYENPGPDEKCQEIETCYYCNLGSGLCEPAHDCTYPEGPECCPGFECSTQGHCGLDLDCDQADPVCAASYTCNFDTLQCEWVECCEPDCGAMEFCDSDCVCQSGCHEEGAWCDPLGNNCCPGLICPFFVFQCSTF